MIIRESQVAREAAEEDQRKEKEQQARRAPARLAWSARWRSVSVRGPARSRIATPASHPPSGSDRIGSGARPRSSPLSTRHSIHLCSSPCPRGTAESLCSAREPAPPEGEVSGDSWWSGACARVWNTGALRASPAEPPDGPCEKTTLVLCSTSGGFGPRKSPRRPKRPATESLMFSLKLSLEHSA
jgi:hypothetical protein